VVQSGVVEQRNGTIRPFEAKQRNFRAHLKKRLWFSNSKHIVGWTKRLRLETILSTLARWYFDPRKEATKQ
jgi:hypothetical protein